MSCRLAGNSHYIAREKAWRRTAITALAVAAIAVAGVVWLGGQSKIIPYIVQIDKEGVAVAVQPAEEGRGIQDQDRVVKAILARWIVDLRTVTPDVHLEKSAIQEVYAHLNQNDPAEAEINGYFTDHNPFTRAEKELVGVEVLGVLEVSPQTWQVEWNETSRNRRGDVTGKERMKAMITIEIVPVQDEKTIRQNPIGLYVKNIDWTKEL
ncbi:MAG: VirB8/TrbF family protein [Syntrophobacteraceae bacterium]